MNGIAKVKISDGPGKYTITTKYNGGTYTNKVTVKKAVIKKLKKGKTYAVKVTYLKDIVKSSVKVSR